jgi:dihydroflavonol-4-reductase
MKVLVTGGSGQIGSAVAAALVERGHTVRCLLRPTSDSSLLDGRTVEVVLGDVTSPASLTSAVRGVQAVVHTAGVVSYDRRQRSTLYRVNVLGTKYLLEAARRAGVARFVHTSSIGTLGHVPDGVVADESAEYNWQELDIPYFDTKREAERLVLEERRMHCIALNPGIVFGPGDVNGNAVRLLRQTASGRLPGVPPGAATFAGLAEVARAHVAAIERGRAGERYVLGGHPLDFSTLYRVIGEVIGHQAPRRVLPAPVVRFLSRIGSPSRFFTGREPALTPALAEIVVRFRRYDSAKAIRELGYEPGPLESSIAACWAFARGERSPSRPATRARNGVHPAINNEAVR